MSQGRQMWSAGQRTDLQAACSKLPRAMASAPACMGGRTLLRQALQLRQAGGGAVQLGRQLPAIQGSRRSIALLRSIVLSSRLRCLPACTHNHAARR
jgi:hypothetical protein